MQLTPLDCGVEVGVGVEGTCVAGGVVLVLLVVEPPEVGFFVGFFVGCLVVAGVGVVVFAVEVGVGVAAGVLVVPPDKGVPPPESEVPPPRVSPLVEPNCGGVIESTAPRPPIVPPAIKKKRLPIIIYSFR